MAPEASPSERTIGQLVADWMTASQNAHEADLAERSASHNHTAAVNSATRCRNVEREAWAALQARRDRDAGEKRPS